MESMSALEETNRMLKMDRDKLEQELQQAQARVRLTEDKLQLHLFPVLSDDLCLLNSLQIHPHFIM